MEHWSIRLKDAMRLRNGMSQTALAKASGLPRPLVEKYCNAKVDKPRGDKLRVLAEALHVDPLWLEKGIGDQSLYMPVTYMVGAGDEVRAWGEEFDYIECPGADPERHIVAQIQGASMEPYAQNREFVLAVKAPAATPEKVASYDIPAIVETVDGLTYLKKLAPVPGKPGHFDLISFNPAFDPIRDVEIAWAAPVVRRWNDWLG